jgi:hypothetical protein
VFCAAGVAFEVAALGIGLVNRGMSAVAVATFKANLRSNAEAVQRRFISDAR